MQCCIPPTTPFLPLYPQRDGEGSNFLFCALQDRAGPNIVQIHIGYRNLITFLISIEGCSEGRDPPLNYCLATQHTEERTDSDRLTDCIITNNSNAKTLPLLASSNGAGPGNLRKKGSSIFIFITQHCLRTIPSSSSESDSEY